MISDCGNCWVNHNSNKHFIAGNNYISATFYRIIYFITKSDKYNKSFYHKINFHWKIEAYIGTIKFINEQKGLKRQLEKLKETNPNHYYIININNSIKQHEESILMGINKLNDEPKYLLIFKWYYILKNKLKV